LTLIVVQLQLSLLVQAPKRSEACSMYTFRQTPQPRYQLLFS
ncbi:MAG: hypothetical protein ACI85S_001244, partial [Pseudohongiellaceae bacterium]